VKPAVSPEMGKSLRSVALASSTSAHEQTVSSKWKQRLKRAGCVYFQQKGFFGVVLKVFKVNSSQANFNLFCSRQGKRSPLV